MSTQNPKEEKTLLIVKPDGVKRGLTGDIISRIEQRGLKIIALEMIHATKEQVHDHYPKDPAWIKRLGEKSINTYKEHGMDPKEELGTDDPAKIGEMVRSWLLDFLFLILFFLLFSVVFFRSFSFHTQRCKSHWFEYYA